MPSFSKYFDVSINVLFNCFTICYLFHNLIYFFRINKSIEQVIPIFFEITKRSQHIIYFSHSLISLRKYISISPWSPSHLPALDLHLLCSLLDSIHTCQAVSYVRIQSLSLYTFSSRIGCYHEEIKVHQSS